MSATLTCLSSGSSANGYILRADNDILILECGVPVTDCLRALNYDITLVEGCCVSHSDGDHAKYTKQYQTYFHVYSTPSMAGKYDGVHPLRPLTKYTIGGFKVVPFQVEHGDKDCYSYLITHSAIGNLLFITDAENFPYRLQGVNTLMIEANYSDDIRVDALLNGAELRAQSRNHMELNETIATIRRLGRPHTILCHLSQGLSDEAMFKKRIFAELGVHAEIAVKGSVHDLSKEDF